MPIQYDKLGLDPRTQQDILNEHTAQRWQQQIAGEASMRYRAPADQTAGHLGTILGGLFSNKFNPTQLNQPEQRAMALKDRTLALYTERLKGNTSLGEEDKAILLQQAAADAHFEQGNYGQYNELVMQSAAQARARKQAEASQKLLDAEVSSIEDNASVLDAKATEAQAGESIPFILPGEDPLVATARIGRLQPDQSLEVYNEDGSKEILTQYMPLDQAIDLARLKKQAEEDGGETPVQRIWSSSLRDQLKQAPLAQLEQAEVVNALVDTVLSVVDEGQDPDTLMSTPGGALSFVDKVRATGKAAGNYITELLDEDGDVVFAGNLSTEGQRRALLQSAPAVKEAFNRIVVPPVLKTEAERQAWRSAVYQLAWTTWRASEGSGARQASNQDFAIALDELGANSGSIRAMLGTAARRISRGSTSYQNLVRSTRTQGVAAGWTQEKVDNQIFGGLSGEATDKMQKALGRVENLLGPGPEAEPEEQSVNMAVPEGVTPEEWAVMTPEEKALF